MARSGSRLRDGLGIEDGRLTDRRPRCRAVAREHGTPLYVYDLDRVSAKLRVLTAALDGAGLRHVVRFAVKANHHPEVLAVVRELGAAIDASSPGEVELALREGFSADRVSFTGTNISERDLDVLLATGVHVNVDLLSQLRRTAAVRPARPLASASTRAPAARTPVAARRSTAAPGRPSSASTRRGWTRRCRSRPSTA